MLAHIRNALLVFLKIIFEVKSPKTSLIMFGDITHTLKPES